MEQWKKISGEKPFLVKGVQTKEDALKCVEIGCDGVVVSNHGASKFYDVLISDCSDQGE